MMANNKEGNLLLIAFDRLLGEQCAQVLSPFCNLDCINSMESLEASVGEPGAVLYLMDLTSANHIYNINFIRNKYPEIQFFVITTAVSIPLLHQSLHIGVNDLFILPLSEQDKEALYYKLKNDTNVVCIAGNIENTVNFFPPQISKFESIESLLDIIERDYAKGPSLQDLSDALHLSPSRICHLFKDVCGVTYSSYLLCRKVEEGERLLTCANKSITHIAYQIGFANPSHFCRSFKEHFNITPTSYASGNRDIAYSAIYLKYQKLRTELFSNLAIKSPENNIVVAEKYNVS